MATASVTNNFVQGTTAVSADVDENYADLVSFINASVVHVDGSKAYTAPVSCEGPGALPTLGPHLASKVYIDDQPGIADVKRHATLGQEIPSSGSMTEIHYTVTTLLQNDCFSITQIWNPEHRHITVQKSMHFVALAYTRINGDQGGQHYDGAVGSAIYLMHSGGSLYQRAMQIQQDVNTTGLYWAYTNVMVGTASEGMYFTGYALNYNNQARDFFIHTDSYLKVFCLNHGGGSA